MATSPPPEDLIIIRMAAAPEELIRMSSTFLTEDLIRIRMEATINVPHLVTIGLNGFATALEYLEDTRARIGATISRIPHEPDVIVPVDVNLPVLHRAFEDIIRHAIPDSIVEIELAMDDIVAEFDTSNNLVMFPEDVRTIEVAVSTSVIMLHSLLQFSDLQLNGHGPCYRIQRDLADIHMALS